MKLTDTLDRLDEALLATGRIVSGLTDDQWDLRSPCEEWDVRQVTNHLVGGLRIFTAQLTGEIAPGDHDGCDWLTPNAHQAYAAAAEADRAAWRLPGTETIVFDLAFGQVPAPMAAIVHLTEVVVHGLDIAVATGREHLVDQELSARLLAVMRAIGTDAFRVPGIFGPEQPSTKSDPPHRQLLAHLGRGLNVG